MSVRIANTKPQDVQARSSKQAIFRGAAQRCPACGEGALYSSYLKVNDICPACGQELFHQRADDAPPYFTMFIVGHVVVALVLMVEDLFAPALWVHALLWTPLVLGMSLWLLPRVKGALIGLQWANRMHGFGGEDEDVFGLDPAAVPGRQSGVG